MTKNLITTDRRALQRYRPPTEVPDNLSGDERRALTQLRQNPNIIIKPADKGSKIIIMDRQQYLLEANRQLNNPHYYRLLDDTLQTQTQTRLRQTIKTLYTKKYITAKQRDFLFGSNTPRPRYFYLLPKIHKDPETWTIPFEVPPGRPIVSDCNSTTYNTAKYIEHFLGPLSTLHPSYIKDTYHFLDTIRPMVVPNNSHLFTIDIDSLYTNINTGLGLQTISSIFSKHPDKNRPDKELLQLLELCLTHNDFLFNNQFYLQIHGTAMGQRFAPSYANLYMSEWEREALAKCTYKPLIYLRFLDDIFGIWQHDIALFPQFINTLNTHHPSIRVKHTLDPLTVNFLDTTILLHPLNTTHKQIKTKVFFKATDTHALLHKSSYHPKHTFTGIIKSQIIRFHRICTDKPDFHQATTTLFNSLKTRGYSKRYLRTVKNMALASLTPTRSTPPPQVQTAVTSTLPPPPPPPSPYPNQGMHPNPTLPIPNPHSYLNPPSLRGAPDVTATTHTPTQSPQLIPLVSTFSKKIIPLHRIIKQNFNSAQQYHPAIRNHRPISAYRKNPNLQNLLTRSQFTDHNPPPPTQLSSHYKNRKFIHNPYTRTSFPTLGTFSLTTTNAVYIITCTTCQKHYIGETQFNIATRLKQHLYNIHKGTKQTPIVTHFQHHPPTQLIISGLENNDHWTCGQRKRAEKIWIHKLGTVTPTGLNDD